MNNKKNSSLSLRKVILSAMVAAPLAIPAPLWALPATQAQLDALVVSKTTGVNAVVLDATHTSISTTATNSVIKWSSFGGTTPATMSIAAGDSLSFQLPSSSAAVLNIVNSTGGAFASAIDGSISSNGSFYLINQNGILVSTTGSITSTGGAVGLSTIPESEFYFLANGYLSYVGTATAGVTLEGNATINAASGSGNVFVAGKDIALAGTINGGALTVNSQNKVELAKSGNLTVGNTTAYASSLNVNVSGTGDLSVGTGANSVTVNGNTGKFTLGGGNVTQGTGLLKFGDTTNDVNLTISGAADIAVANASANGKTLKATLSSATVSNFSASSSAAIGVTTTGAAVLATTGATSDLTLNASTVGGTLSVTAAREVKSGGTSTVSGAVTLASGNAKGITYSATGDLNLASITVPANTDVSITSTTGSVALPAIATGTGKLTVTAATDISNKAGTALTVGGDATFDAANSINLSATTNDFAGVILKRAAGGATVVDANGFTIKDGTNLSGNATLTSQATGVGTIALGAASADKITVAGNLTIATNGNTVTQGSDNTTVLGNVTITAGAGSVTLGGKTNNGVNLKNQYGQIKIVSASAATIYEQTTLNLGDIAMAGSNLRVYSATGIVQSGALSVANLLIGAGSAAAPADIALSTASNAITGTIDILDDVTLLSGGPIGATIGNYLAKNVTVVNNASTTIGNLTNTYGTGLAGDLNVTATSGVSAITLGATVASGKVILNAPGAVTATGTNSISNYNVTSGAAVDVRSSTDVTFNATLSGSSNANFQSGNTATIGAVNSATSGQVTFKSGNKKNVADSVAGISIFGAVKFDSANAVTVTKSGHSFGPITIVTANNSGASVVESGTLNLASASINGRGALALTSTNGDILQSTAGGITLGNSAGTASFTARNGKVTVDGGTGNNNFKTGTVSLTASGDSVLVSKSSDLNLGNITVSAGALTVTQGTADLFIAQKSGTTINAYGTSTFTTTSTIVAPATPTATITLANSGNRFGGLVLSSGNADIAITEATTMNLKSVTTTGKFTAVSENGNIIDSTDTAIASNKLLVSTSAASFSAPNGSIALSLAGSQYGNVALNAKGNVSILSSGPGNLTLAGSTIGGTLDVVTTLAGANILQNGTVSVAGDTTLTTNGGGIDLQDTMNQFGAIRFVAGAAGVKIFEATTLNLRGGSLSTGAAVLSTNGDFVTSGAGGSSFTGDLTISALGTIKPGTGSLLVVGTFTVFSNNTKDLSGLSKSGNLTGKDPVNLGSGSYTAPSL